MSSDFPRQLEGYGLTTAHILYRMPDHPALLQTYLWQDYDLCPKFPVLNRFLAFWLEKLEGPLHSVTVAHARLIKPAAEGLGAPAVGGPNSKSVDAYRPYCDWYCACAVCIVVIAFKAPNSSACIFAIPS